MDGVLFMLTLIGTIATVISTVISVKAKNEAKNILQQVREEISRNIDNVGKIELMNTGTNTGVINAINSGDIHND